MSSFQLLLHPDGLLLLPRTTQSHPRAGRPVVHRTKSAAALEPVHGTGRRYGDENGEGSRDPACGVIALILIVAMFLVFSGLRNVCVVLNRNDHSLFLLLILLLFSFGHT